MNRRLENQMRLVDEESTRGRCSNYISLGDTTGKCAVTGEAADMEYCLRQADYCKHSGDSYDGEKSM